MDAWSRYETALFPHGSKSELCAAGVWTLGCAAGSAPSPPPPPLIEVTVKPATGSLVLGGQTTFTATVTNTSDTAGGWSVSGVPGGNTMLGTDATTGAVIDATLGGWSCSGPGPAQFDGSHEIDGLAVGRS